MAKIVDSLVTDLVLNGVQAYQSGMKDSAGATRGLEQNQRALLASAMALAPVFGTLSASALSATKSMISMADEFQQLEIGFDTLFKNMGRGANASKEFINELKSFSAATPFTYRETGKLSKQLMAYQISAKDTIPLMRTLGDATTALGGGEDSLQRLVRAMGQINAKGKMTGEEVRQLAEVGIPAMKILSEKLGISASAVGSVGRAGISSEKAIAALTEGMNEAFGGGMEARMQTLSGQWSNLQDYINYISADLGDSFIPILVDATKGASHLVDALSALPTGVKSIIAWTIALGGLGASLKFVLALLSTFRTVQGLIASQQTLNNTLSEASTRNNLAEAASLNTLTAAIAAQNILLKEQNVLKAEANKGVFSDTAMGTNWRERTGSPVVAQPGPRHGQLPQESLPRGFYSEYPMQPGQMQGPYSRTTRGGTGTNYLTPGRQGISHLLSPGTIRGAQAARSGLSSIGGTLAGVGRGALAMAGGVPGLVLMATVGGIMWGAKAIADRNNMVDEFSKAAEEGIFIESPFSKAVVRDFESNKAKIGKAAAGALSDSLDKISKKTEEERAKIEADQKMKPPKTPLEFARQQADLSEKDVEEAKTRLDKAKEQQRQNINDYWLGGWNTLDELREKEQKMTQGAKDVEAAKLNLENKLGDNSVRQTSLSKASKDEADADLEWARNNGASYDAAKTKALNLQTELSGYEIQETRADILKDLNSKYDSLMRQAEAGYRLRDSLIEQSKYTKDAEEQTSLLEASTDAETEAMKDWTDANDLLIENQKEENKAKKDALDLQKELSQARVAEAKGKSGLINEVFGEKSSEAERNTASLRQLLSAEAENALQMGDTVRYYELATEATKMYRNSVESLYGSLMKATEVGSAYTDYLRTIGMDKQADNYTRDVLSKEYAGLAQDAFGRGDQASGYKYAAQAETAARSGNKRKKKGQLTGALGDLGTGAPGIGTLNQEFADKFGGLMDPYSGMSQTKSSQISQNKTIVNITNVFSAGTEYQKAESIRIQNDTNEANYYNNFTF